MLCRIRMMLCIYCMEAPVARTPLITKDQLVEALDATGWDLQLTAIRLGVHLTTVYRTARRHGVELERRKAA